MNENGYEEMVCQKFSLNTLGYSSNQVIFNLFKNLGSVGDIISLPDRRGRHPPAHELSDYQIQSIRHHINA